jgi:formate dehydrogenase major subunit
MLQWHHQAVEPEGDVRSDLWFVYHLGRRIREKLVKKVEDTASTAERDRPILDLTWDYPVKGPLDEPEAEAVLAEISGWDSDGKPLSTYLDLADDGSTVSGCWIYCGSYADGVNQTARRKPGAEQSWVAPEWGWAWPLNRRILYNRASAAPDGTPWSERKAYVWWDPDGKKWTGHDVPDFTPTLAPDAEPAEGATGPAALSGTDAFVMQADGKAWLYAPAGLTDGPLPAHYEPQESPVRNPLYRQQRNPARQITDVIDPNDRFSPSGDEPGADVYPYVLSTYRIAEHHTAGGMSRWSAYLAELAPDPFCEVSPELAAERGLTHGEWATLISARNAIEARVLVTDRVPPLRVQGAVVHQVGLPYHWGPNGLVTGDAANDLTSLVMDGNVQIMETKALACDIRPGRRPRGAARAELVAEWRRRAGVTERTGVDV